MRKIYFFAILCYSFIGAAQNNGIQFSPFDSLDAAFKIAQQEKKLIFIDCHFEKCYYCKLLAKNIYTLQSVGDYFNKNFICYSVDVYKSTGLEIKERYRLHSYPTMLFLNEKGELIHKLIGYRSESDVLHSAKIAQDSLKNLRYYQKQMDTGNDSFNILISFLKINPDAENNFTLIDSFINKQPDSLKFSKQVWTLITLYDYYYPFIQKNQNEFKKNVGEENVNIIIERILAFNISRWSQDLLIIQRKKAIKKIKNSGHPLTDRILKCAFMYLALGKMEDKATKRRWDKFLVCLKDYMNGGAFDPVYSYKCSKIILDNYRKFDGKVALNYAKVMQEKYISQEKTFESLKLYSDILFEIGDISNAILIMTEALSLAKQEANEINIDMAKKKLEEYREKF